MLKDVHRDAAEVIDFCISASFATPLPSSGETCNNFFPAAWLALFAWYLPIHAALRRMFEEFVFLARPVVEWEWKGVLRLRMYSPYMSTRIPDASVDLLGVPQPFARRDSINRNFQPQTIKIGA